MSIREKHYLNEYEPTGKTELERRNIDDGVIYRKTKTVQNQEN